MSLPKSNSSTASKQVTGNDQMNDQMNQSVRPHVPSSCTAQAASQNKHLDCIPRSIIILTRHKQQAVAGGMAVDGAIMALKSSCTQRCGAASSLETGKFSCGEKC